MPAKLTLVSAVRSLGELLLLGFLGSAVAADFTLQSNRWHLLTVPADASAESIEELFGDDLDPST